MLKHLKSSWGLPQSQAQPLTLRHNVFWSLLGNSISAACQWGYLIAIAKLGTPEMVGQFTLGLAVTAPIILFTNLQLRSIQAADAQRTFSFQDYLNLRLIMSAVALLLILGIAFGTGLSQEVGLTIAILGIAKVFEAISDVVYGLLHQRQRMDYIAQSLILKGILSLLGLSLFIYLTQRVVWGAASLAVLWSLLLCFYDFRFVARLRNAAIAITEAQFQFTLSWNWSLLRQLFWQAFPLGIEAMFRSLYINIPRYFVAHYGSASLLGYYSSIAYLPFIGNTVILALGQSMIPQLSQAWHQHDHQKTQRLIQKFYIISLTLGCSGLLVAIVFGSEILTLLYDKSYANHSSLFNILMLAQMLGWLSTPLWYYLVSTQHFSRLLLLALIVVISVSFACVWWVPVWGEIGAAWATCLANLIQLLLLALVYRHITRL